MNMRHARAVFARSSGSSQPTSTGTQLEHLTLCNTLVSWVFAPFFVAAAMANGEQHNGSRDGSPHSLAAACVLGPLYTPCFTMTDTPSWLSEEAVQDVKIDDTPTTGVVATQSATAASTRSAAPLELSGGAEAAEADAELPRMILFMRLANLGVAGAMIACSVSGLGTACI